jgi:acyl-CoA synthetase (NDP forming)
MTTGTATGRFTREALREAIVPPAVTVVGATDRSYLASQLLLNLRRADGPFQGQVHFVNPRRPVIAGIQAVADVSEIDGPLGQLYLLLSTDRCAPYLESLEKLPSSVVVVPDGFAESGNAAGEQSLAEWSLATGVPLFGPQAIGTASLHDDFWSLNVPSYGFHVEKGGLALISQSGGLFYPLVWALANRGVGLHTLVSSGNEAAIDYAELGTHLLAEESIRGLAVYAESLRSTERFVAFARQAAELGKPVVLLLAGRSDRASDIARTHTGAAVTSRRIVQGVADQYGLLLANDFDELIWSVVALDATGYRRVGSTGGVGVVSSSGGMTVLFTETLADVGVHCPEPGEATKEAIRPLRPVTTFNPLDFGAATMDHPDVYRELLTTYAQDPAFDILADVRVRPAGPDDPDFLVHHQQMFLDIVRDAGKTPVQTCLMPLEAGESVSEELTGGAVVGYGSRESAVKLRALSAWAATTGLDAGLGELAAELPAARPDGEGEVVTGPEVQELLGELPLRWPSERTVGSVEELPAAIEALGLPLVAKAEAGLAHRASEGAVIVGLATPEAAAAAVSYLVGRFACPVTLSQYVAHDDELFVGFEWNEAEGPVVAFGAGGQRAGEDVELRVLPATEEQLRRLVTRRAAAPAEAEQLTALVVALQQAVLANPSIRAIDLNPVVFDEAGRLTALDVKAHL